MVSPTMLILHSAFAAAKVERAGATMRAANEVASAPSPSPPAEDGDAPRPAPPPAPPLDATSTACVHSVRLRDVQRDMEQGEASRSVSAAW